MSKRTKREAALAPASPAETLLQQIRDRGLDACGDLITAATPAQLTSLLDLDLWRPARPGQDAQFDAERFGESLEVLVDAGEAVAARTIASLDRQLVAVALSRYVRVFDPGIFEPTAAGDDEPPATGLRDARCRARVPPDGATAEARASRRRPSRPPGPIAAVRRSGCSRRTGSSRCWRACTAWTVTPGKSWPRWPARSCGTAKPARRGSRAAPPTCSPCSTWRHGPAWPACWTSVRSYRPR